MWGNTWCQISIFLNGEYEGMLIANRNNREQKKKSPDVVVGLVRERRALRCLRVGSSGVQGKGEVALDRSVPVQQVCSRCEAK
jgi:hypothetical protein